MAAFFIILIFICIFSAVPIYGLISIFFTPSLEKKNAKDEINNRIPISNPDKFISPFAIYANKTPEMMAMVRKRLIDGGYSKPEQHVSINKPDFHEKRNADYNKPLREIASSLMQAYNQTSSDNAFYALELILPHHFKKYYYAKHYQGTSGYYEEKYINVGRSYIARLIVMCNISWSEVERAAVQMFKLSMINVDFNTMNKELDILRGVSKQWFKGLAYDEFIHSTNTYSNSQEMIKDDAVPFSLRATDNKYSL